MYRGKSMKTLILLILFGVSFDSWPVDMSSIEPSRNVKDAILGKEKRLSVFIQQFLNQSIPTFDQGGFTQAVLARILSKQKLDEVNASIMAPTTKVLGKVGTDFDGVLGICKQKGDYDFKLTGLIPIVYEGIKRGVFSTAAYQKILGTLLTETGNEHQTRVRLGVCVKLPETENHILMIESARYLTNQLWATHYPNNPRFDNEKNGFNSWWLKHLQQFLKRDFEEFNSRPYQGHSVKPLLNLINYAKDERVVKAATMVLDYLSAKFAVQSSRLRRYAPICRQHVYSKNTSVLQGDHLTSFFAMMTGNIDIYQYNDPKWHLTYAPKTALMAGLTNYRPPVVVMDMIIHHDQVLEQRVHHDGVESYYNHPKFLITAGGKYLNRFDGGMGKRDGWAYPTTVMPQRGGDLQREQLLRIDGSYREKYRNNMCHYKNFACGMNIRLPKDLPVGCIVKKGDWTFLNYNTTSCPLKYGYYAAILTLRYPKPPLLHKRFASNYGLFEIVDSSQTTFENFVSKTLKNNHGRKYTHFGRNYYTTFAGDEIEFNPGNADLNRWPIGRVNGRSVISSLYRNWNFLEGNILKAKGDGLVEFHNPKLGYKYVMDYRDYRQPRSYIEKL